MNQRQPQNLDLDLDLDLGLEYRQHQHRRYRHRRNVPVMSDWYAAQCRWKMAQDRYIAISAIQMILHAQLPSVLRENAWLLDVVPELSYTGLML